jgi:8-oxo-dGTP pyrophosphatase MutT (NUDIX family)
MTDPAPIVRAAATIVLMREEESGPPALLMLERAATMRFAAGAMVFPGGAVDPADGELAARLATGLAPDEAAARIAAIRETIEEAGLAIGFSSGPPPAVVAMMRSMLIAGAGFAAALERTGQRLDLEALVPFARWRPAAMEKLTHVFDTRFYLARHPGGEASVDGSEHGRLIWTSAAALLAEAGQGRHRLVYPTRRNLERLALFASHAEAVAQARTVPVETITPWIETRGGRQWLCIPAHLGYPVTAELLETSWRG